MSHTIIITGNVGRDPELRYTQSSGLPVCNFSVATNRKYTKKDGERVEETIWFKVSVWGQQAIYCNQYLQKGSKVRIDGRLTPAPDGNPPVWQGDDGSSYASYDVSASYVEFLANTVNQPTGQMPEDEEEFPY